MDICYLLSHGFAARMVLHSDLVPAYVGAGMSVGIVVPEGTQDSLQLLATQKGVSCVLGAEPPAGFLSANLDVLRRNAFEDVRSNPALWAKYLRETQVPGRLWKKARSRALLAANQTLQRFPSLRKAAEGAQRPLYRNQAANQLLRSIRPRCLVSTYPVSTFESSFLESARRLGIATVGHLLSWDNITCKGRFPIVPEYFLSWGQIMSGEIREHYEAPNQNIFEVGVPHFDIHKSAGRNTSLRSAALAEVGLSVERPYIFFGMSSPYFAPREIDIVEDLARRVRGGHFGDEIQLLVRPHPQNVTGSLADETWLPRLRALQSDRIGVNFPSLKGGLDWYTEDSDVRVLGALLGGATVSLNSGSTLSIDSLIHGIPVVITAHDGGADLPWWQSARRCVEYPHLAKLLAKGGIEVTRNPGETLAAIQGFLDDPGRGLAQREAACLAECGVMDGGSAKRAASAAATILRSLHRSSQVSRVAR